MVALETYYIGPSNYRGSRLGVRRLDEARKPEGASLPHRITISYPDEYSGEECHFQGIKEFCKRYDWHGKLVAGGTERGYVWVFVPKDTPTTETSYPTVWEV